MKRLLTILMLILASCQVAAQGDSLRLQPHVIPLTGASLFSAGALVSMRPELHDIEVSLYDRIGLANATRTTVDNYLQFVPVVAPIVLNIAGVKGEHSLGDVTLLTATGYLLGLAAVETGKIVYRTVRPDGAATTSFPSGHTFSAFAGAEVLRREYGKSHPWIAYAGYGVAFLVGALRVYNSRHWPSDVIGGAGVALLSVSASYALWNK